MSFKMRAGAAKWADDDAERASADGMLFPGGWFLPRHGIDTTHCRWWAHYVAQGSYFWCYDAAAMRDELRRGDYRVVYTPRKAVGPPTNRGVLYPWRKDPAGLLFAREAHESFCGVPLVEMARGVAGKLSELHFVGTVYERTRQVEFADAWQDQKGNDVRLKTGDWVQVKLDAGAAESGNLYVQTHTRTKGTDWLDAPVNGGERCPGAYR